MNVAPFRPEHLDRMTLGRVERDDPAMGEFRRGIGDMPGPAWTVMDGDKPLGSFGIVIAGDEGWSWAAFSDALRGCPFALHRPVARELANALRVLSVVHGTIKKGWPAGRKWLERLGYKKSGEIETMYGTLERFSKWA